MRVDEIQVGKVYEGKGSTLRVVFAVRDGTAKYIATTKAHSVLGESAMPMKNFASWAVREVPPVEAV